MYTYIHHIYTHVYAHTYKHTYAYTDIHNTYIHICKTVCNLFQDSTNLDAASPDNQSVESR